MQKRRLEIKGLHNNSGELYKNHQFAYLLLNTIIKKGFAELTFYNIHQRT